MSVSLLLPGALLPREVVRALAESLAQTGLASVFARAELAGDSEAEAPAHLAWLGERLFRCEMPLATAPFAYAALAGNAPPADVVLWHADPVHLEVARDHLELRPLGALPSDEETTALIAAANALAADTGAEFVRVADRWFLRTADRWDLQAQPLAAALGEPLHAVMPEGPDAPMWNRLLTEIQMTWHAHAVNEAREAIGTPTVNSLWLHGGGTWSALPRADYTAVHADDPEWRGAAEAAGITASSADAPPTDGALLVWSELLEPRLLHDWAEWIAALRRLDARLAPLARSTALDVVLTGGTTVRRLRARPSDRLKFWRAGSAEQVLAE